MALNQRILALCTTLSQSVGLTAGLIGGIYTAASVTGIQARFHILSLMSDGSSIVVGFSGISLWLRSKDHLTRVPGLARRPGFYFAVVVFLLGVLNLIVGPLTTVAPYISVSPSEAAYACLMGFSLAALDLEIAGRFRPAQLFAFVACALALFAFIGHIYALYGLASHTGMTMLASVMGLMLAVGGLCARSDRGVMAIVTHAGPGGIMARRLLTGVIGIPTLLGLFRLEGERHGLYDGPFGISLLVVLIIVSFLGMTWWYAQVLNRTDEDRLMAEDMKHQAEQDLASQRALSVRADRLRSLGEMAAGIAHELNQPLVGVRGLAEHLLLGMDRGWVTPDDKAREKLKLILDQADRMTHIIEHARLFSRNAGKPDTEPVDVNEIVRTVKGMIETQFQAQGIAIHCILADTLPRVMANTYSLEEVLINLMINARDAVEDYDRADTSGKHLPVEVSTRMENDRVVIVVRDHGRGIPAEILPNVFDPFFTTKGPERGTGLGLAVCKSLIEQMDGTISIHSVVNQGTGVTVSLPALSQPVLRER